MFVVRMFLTEKLLKAFYSVFGGFFTKIHSILEISIGEGK